MNIRKFIDRFCDDQSGVTAVEYGLITAMISVVILGALTLTGTGLNETFGFIANTLKGN